MKQVSITRNGKTYTGTYTIKSGMIYVTCEGRTKTPTQIGYMAEHVLAEMLLGEMISIEAVQPSV